ncbi:MAG TPA: hypothetical protein VG826_34550 [Pirellulales bacterium]|nr:hypothetical protein [Pirellulales bacterium]
MSSRALQGSDAQVLILNDLPDEVRRFIASNISSVAQLEVLLLLREHRDREWTADEVSRALYAAAGGMADQLNDLVSRGLAYVTETPERHYRYRLTKDDTLDAVVDSLMKVYKERRVAVISLIYSEPIDNARSFADAFRIRKEKEG